MINIESFNSIIKYREIDFVTEQWFELKVRETVNITRSGYIELETWSTIEIPKGLKVDIKVNPSKINFLGVYYFVPQTLIQGTHNIKLILYSSLEGNITINSGDILGIGHVGLNIVTTWINKDEEI